MRVSASAPPITFSNVEVEPTVPSVRLRLALTTWMVARPRLMLIELVVVSLKLRLSVPPAVS